MTYSEFGRRARENQSRGTDHGAAAPHFVMGGRVKGGLWGTHPDLGHLENDDLSLRWITGRSTTMFWVNGLAFGITVSQTSRRAFSAA